MSAGIPGSFHFFPLGDSGLVIDFGNRLDTAINVQVLALFEMLQRARLSWITDLVPAYSSLAVFYDSQLLPNALEGPSTFYEQAAGYLQLYLSTNINRALPESGRQLHIPVCYEGAFAPDLEQVAKWSGLSTAEVIRLHTSTSFRVYMIGFLPGFAYMGAVPDAIAVNRRSEPRTSVPAGSVGLAGKQTGIYPFDSPGGWQLIGKTPVSLFNKQKTTPTFFQPGDAVQFYPITINEFTNYKSGVV